MTKAVCRILPPTQRQMNRKSRRDIPWEGVGYTRPGQSLSVDWPWNWTNPASRGYLDFRPADVVTGDFSGRFAADQLVLLGDFGAMQLDYVRPICRNYFDSRDKWRFMECRLVGDSA